MMRRMKMASEVDFTAGKRKAHVQAKVAEKNTISMTGDMWTPGKTAEKFFVLVFIFSISWFDSYFNSIILTFFRQGT
jgi:hypothetical protein